MMGRSVVHLPRVRPPSTGMILPVVMVNWVWTAQTVSATSSGTANRSRGVPSICACIQAGSKCFAYSPSTNPGDTDTTRIFGAKARPNDRESESNELGLPRKYDGRRGWVE